MRVRRFRTILGIGLLVFFGSTAAAYSSTPSWDSQGTYTTTFDDEFNATAVNGAVWEKGWFLGLGKTGVSGPVNGGETACYNSSHVSEPGDGFLHLTLTNQASSCKGTTRAYTGALVDSRVAFAQAGGSFEARVFLPVAGTKPAGWPAWWQNGPSNVSWPAHGEIDTVEALSGSTASHLHYLVNSTAQGPGCYTATPRSGWHTFGERWNPALGVVTFYWDGARLCSHTFSGPYAEYLIFDYTMEGGSVRPAFPSSMLVDWVRVWR